MDYKESIMKINNLPPINTVENENLTDADMMSFIYASVNQNGLIGHNLAEYNDMIENAIRHIIKTFFSLQKNYKNIRTNEEDQKIKTFKVEVEFDNIQIGQPRYVIYSTGQSSTLFPSQARIAGLTYSSPITLEVNINIKAIHKDGHIEEKSVNIPPFHIGNFPTMVRGTNCSTKMCSKIDLEMIDEDPNDEGGYFLVGGNEYALTSGENIVYNIPHIHKAIRPNEYIRAEIISQPGGIYDNSSQLRIRFMSIPENAITLEINSPKFEKVKIPFMLIYYLFGMSNHKEICETIVFDIEKKDKLTSNILDVLEKSFYIVTDSAFDAIIHERNHEVICKIAAEKMLRYISNPNYSSDVNGANATRYIINDLIGTPTNAGSLDKVLLPHIGQGPNSRIRKLRYIGLAIRQMFMVHYEIIEPADRDSFSTKRLFGPSALTKTFKSKFNQNVVIPALNGISRALKNNGWSSITPSIISNSFKNSISVSDLNRAMEQSITTANGTVSVGNNGKVDQNRAAPRLVERKNPLQLVSVLRTITTPSADKASKNTDRAKDMRKVHPSMCGFVCISHSPDTGPGVGLNKQLAITASIAPPSDVLPLKLIIGEDKDFIPFNQITNAMMLESDLSLIYTNGEIIGACRNGIKFVQKYRIIRRAGNVIDQNTTIYWNSILNKIEFWIDYGRLRRPLLIVDNNIEEYDRSRTTDINTDVKFVQNTRFTIEHVNGIKNGTITLQDLINEGIAEYITPSEMLNCVLAESISELRIDKNNVLKQYTHLEIPQAIFGLASLRSPYGNHTQPARISYVTNQSRQAGSWFSYNPISRFEKNRTMQKNIQHPLVDTITGTFIKTPNSKNLTVAYLCYGNNQEDSVICKQGLFHSVLFKIYKTKLQKGESFCNPNALITKNLKPANYEKLVDGVVLKGTVIEYGDVITGKVGKLSKDNSEYKFIDQSVVYLLKEPAIVMDSRFVRGPEDELIAIIKLQYEREIVVGDKLSSREGNKFIVSSILPAYDLPFMEDGTIPDLIINPHSIPTRMTIGQIMENWSSIICVKESIFIDGTSFLPFNHEEIGNKLVDMGLRFNGCSRLYDGTTGVCFDSAIFVTPCAIQRITKFVYDDKQCVGGSGPTDAITGQPLGGKAINGGLRIGEMEGWAMKAHGAMLNYGIEKMRLDSDGRVLNICRRCGLQAIYNEYNNIYRCNRCEGLADIEQVNSSGSFSAIYAKLSASNCQLRLNVNPFELPVH